MTGSNDARRYRVLDVLGRGGFGTVYRAELQGSQGFRKEVALKVLNDGIEASAQHLALLRDEARVLGLVRHRAIVAVDGLVKLEGRWCVVMEYVRGITLKQLLASEGPLPPAIALQLAEEVASALDAAYNATDGSGRPLRLLHRDVKPSNIQVTPRGEVKLLDFGVARAEFEAREHSTQGMIFGSLPYVAPERLEREDTHAVDVYALSLTLAALMAGRIPRRGPGDRADQEARQDEVDALLVGTGTPAPIRELVRRGTAFGASERPSAREFERESRRLRGALPDLSLRDWLEPRVEALLDDVGVGGEFTGMVLTEASTADRGVHLAELLGSAIPTTFDDPNTGDVFITPTTTYDPITAEQPPVPPPPPARRRWRTWIAAFVVAGGLAAAVAVIAVIAAMAGGTAMFGAVLVAVVTDAETGCNSQVKVGRDLITERNIKPQRKALALMDLAEQECLAGRLGFWGGAFVVQSLTIGSEDGVLDASELAEVEHTIRSWSR